MPIVKEFLQERGTLIRGMAHPTLFRGAFPGQQQMQQTDGGIYSKFGALEVSPFSFYEMLKRNETVLLFPGGAREALHGRGENNKLFWPEKVDFVRMAGIFNAIIVPFAAVGVADSVNFVVDREDFKRAPAWLRGGDGAGARPAMAQARAGIVEDFTPSLFLPKPQVRRNARAPLLLSPYPEPSSFLSFFLGPGTHLHPIPTAHRHRRGGHLQQEAVARPVRHGAWERGDWDRDAEDVSGGGPVPHVRCAGSVRK